MKQVIQIFQRLLILVLVAMLTACSGVVPEDATDTSTVHTRSEMPISTVRPLESKLLEKEEAANASSELMADSVKKQPVPAVMGRNVAEPQARLQSDLDMASIRHATVPVDREQYAKITDNAVKSVLEHPVSTFSVDVDSGAYSLVRRSLNQGRLPATDVVRIEELINYFDYAYPTPQKHSQSFSVITEVSQTPWNSDSHLVHIGIKGFESAKGQRPASNLVFLIDVSGSMDSADKLPLLKTAFKLLVKQLNEQDRVSMVVYAGASGVVLEPTKGNQQGKILAALDRLTADGSTHGSAGIQLAYAMAEQEKIPNGINRVILATDGDFNVGAVNHERLMDLIEQKRRQGITLTTLGFGQGNYNDHLMEQLADKGNGNYAYIDTINEAQKVLVDELTATLETIAKDVKIQIEWNPAVIAEYRLIGYTNRLLNREDFNNDKVDAGDIGAGHSVTALYEVSLAKSDGHRLEPLRYQKQSSGTGGVSDEVALLRLRYKDPDAEDSKLIEQVIRTESIIDDLAATSDAYRFSAAVAGFGQLLRGGRYTESFNYDSVVDLARGARGEDRFGYRGEFLRLVNLASSLGS